MSPEKDLTGFTKTVTDWSLPLTAATFGSELMAAIYTLRWMELALVVLIALDFGYGIADSVGRRGAEFHFSRAGRRTLGKALEYNAFLAAGLVFGAAFEPLGARPEVCAAMGLAVALVLEADSISDHFCAVHGLKRRWSVKALLVGWLTRRLNLDGSDLDGANEANGANGANGDKPTNKDKKR